MKGLLLIFAFLASLTGWAQENELTFGLVYDGPSAYLDDKIMRSMKKEIITLLQRDYRISFPEEKVLDSNYDLKQISANLDLLMADEEVDVVICMGVLASSVAITRPSFAKPVYAPFAISELPTYSSVNGGSGIKNFNYLATPNNLVSDVAIMSKMKPLKKVHIIALDLFVELIPGLEDSVRRAFLLYGLETQLVLGSTSAEEVLKQLPDGAEMAYISPLIRFNQVEKQKLYDGLIEKGIPSFAMLGRDEVELGALAGSSPKSDMVRWFRRLAINVQRGLMGEELSSLPVVYKENSKLVINMKTARRINWFPSWALQVEAELLHEDPENIERSLTLKDVVLQAVEANPSLKASAEDLEIGRQQIALAKAARKPSLNADATYLQIDKSSADASLGSQPESSSALSLGLEQVLYSEGVSATIQIQERLQHAREMSFQSERLDVALTAATRFLNFLKARASYRIQKDNLDLTLSNLETAVVRRDIGIAGPAEVFRWEAQVANHRLNALTAKNRAHTALYALNEVLGHYQEELLEAVVPNRLDPKMRTGQEMAQYMGNARDFEVLRAFMVDEGLRDSPELAQLDALIMASRRQVKSGERGYYMPTISLQAQLRNVLDDSSSGSGLEIPGLPPLDLPQADSTSWNAVLNFRLPLYTGGKRKAQLGTSRAGLKQLELQRLAVANGIELGIRSGMQNVATTAVGITLRNDARKAADQNMKLVEDAYSKGVATTLDLLDAQNAALVAREASTNAEFDFFQALMELQRASGNFDYFTSDQDREAFFQRIRAFFENHQ